MNINIITCCTDTSFYFSLASVIISFAALLVAFIVALVNERHQFEKMVSECLSPFGTFISDAATINDKEEYFSIERIEDAEMRLIEGVNRLLVYGSTHSYKYLFYGSIINHGNFEKNIKSFSYCMFVLENKYIEFRRKNTKGKAAKQDLEFIRQCHKHFEDFLQIISKYTFGFKRKVLFIKKDKYFKDLADFYKEIKDL